MTHDPQHTQANLQQTFAPPMVRRPTPPTAAQSLPAPTVAPQAPVPTPVQPVATTAGQGVSKLGVALRAAPGGLKMVYGGAVALAIATRLPLANVNFDGDVSPVPFSSSGSVLFLAGAGILVWLGVPAMSGGLPRRRVVGMVIVTAVMSLITAGLFAYLPTLAKQSDPLSDLPSLFDSSHPTASPALGLVVLAASLVVVAVGTVRLYGWTKSHPATN